MEACREDNELTNECGTCFKNWCEGNEGQCKKFLRENMMDVMHVCGGAEDRCTASQGQDKDACAAHDQCSKLQKAQELEQKQSEKRMHEMCHDAYQVCETSQGQDDKACGQMKTCDEHAQKSMDEMKKMCGQAEAMCKKSDGKNKRMCDMHKECHAAFEEHKEHMKAEAEAAATVAPVALFSTKSSKNFLTRQK